jgi:Ca2+-binding EF-hand superfamily protein
MGDALQARTILMTRSAGGIRGLGILFKQMDDNGDKKLDKRELHDGLQQYGCPMDRAETDALFDYFDKGVGKDGKISFDELLAGLRGTLNATRKEIVVRAFATLDKSGKGVITLADVKGASHVQTCIVS